MTSIVPDDEAHTPEWMTKEFFEEILRNSEKDDSIEVTDLVVTPGSSVDDHNSSIMFREQITYNTNNLKSAEISLIIKTMFVGQKKAFWEKTDVFKNEITMYSEVIPKFEKLLKEANDDTRIGCRCLYSALEPHQTMVFEDLTKRNFRSPDLFKDDMNLVAMKALNILAKWHALSYKLNDDDAKLSKTFQDGGFSGIDLEKLPIYGTSFNYFLEMLNSESDLQDYVSKFENLIANNFLKKSLKGFKAFKEEHPTNVFVLNHGDMHMKNTMIGDVDGEFEVLLIDFQACQWGPAVIDLTYFLYMSIDSDTRATKREEIIYTYFKTFTETLKQIGFTGKVPKLTDLYKDFLSYKDYEILLILTMMPVLCNTIELAGKPEDPSKINGEYRKNMFFKKTYKEFVKKALPDLLYRGYLD